MGLEGTAEQEVRHRAQKVLDLLGRHPEWVVAVGSDENVQRGVQDAHRAVAQHTDLSAFFAQPGEVGSIWAQDLADQEIRQTLPAFGTRGSEDTACTSS